MSRDSSLDDNPMEDSQDSEETCQQFDEVRKFFSEEECAKLGNLGQRICVYMKENYEYLIRQGLISIVPGSKHPNNQTTEARKHDSDEAQDPGNHGSFQAATPMLELRGSRKEETNVWLGRLRERKNHIVYEEISDPEEDD